MRLSAVRFNIDRRRQDEVRANRRPKLGRAELQRVIDKQMWPSAAPRHHPQHLGSIFRSVASHCPRQEAKKTWRVFRSLPYYLVGPHSWTLGPAAMRGSVAGPANVPPPQFDTGVRSEGIVASSATAEIIPWISRRMPAWCLLRCW